MTTSRSSMLHWGWSSWTKAMSWKTRVWHSEEWQRRPSWRGRPWRSLSDCELSNIMVYQCENWNYNWNISSGQDLGAGVRDIYLQGVRSLWAAPHLEVSTFVFACQHRSNTPAWKWGPFLIVPRWLPMGAMRCSGAYSYSLAHRTREQYRALIPWSRLVIRGLVQWLIPQTRHFTRNIISLNPSVVNGYTGNNFFIVCHVRLRDSRAYQG